MIYLYLLTRIVYILLFNHTNALDPRYKQITKDKQQPHISHTDIHTLANWSIVWLNVYIYDIRKQTYRIMLPPFMVSSLSTPFCLALTAQQQVFHCFLSLDLPEHYQQDTLMMYIELKVLYKVNQNLRYKNWLPIIL